MANYVPTAWVNNVPPAMSAVNLNKLTDELESQASSTSVSHTLPTWVDGAAPALTDAAAWNEMERVLQLVAAAKGLTYTKTTWQSGWTPGRNAANLNKMEAQALANRIAIDGAAGTVYFRGNFETGDFSQWMYVAAINTGYPDTAEDIHGWAYVVHNPPTGSQVAGPVGAGSYAARFDLPAGTRKQRVDAVTPEYNFAIGQDIYFSHEFYLPANWSKPVPFPNQFYTIGQYLSQQPGITANHTMMMSEANIRYVIQSGYINTAFGGAQYNNGGSPTGGVPITYAIPDPLMIKEVWHQLIIRIRAATNSTGIVQVWWRKRPDTTWTQTVNLTGFPTLAWTSSGTPNPSLVNCKDFLNSYRGVATAASTIYHDNFCRASTFAAAESCFA